MYYPELYDKYINDDVIKEFWNLVDKRDDYKCWNWKGYINYKGYGIFYFHKWQELAHRMSYIINKGYIEHGMIIHHRCHNESCVNPNHLMMVTHAQNMRDIHNMKVFYNSHGNIRYEL